MSQGYVYFISCDSGGRQVPVKIGYSNNHPCGRLSAMQTGNPYRLELLGYLRGGQGLERQMHRDFSAHRIAGEWFHLDGPVFHKMLDAAQSLYEHEVMAK